MREYCKGCNYPLVTCVCQWVTPHYPNVDLIVLQHFREVKNAKNTLKLTQLALPKLRTYVVHNASDIKAALLHVNRQQSAVFFPQPSSLSFEQHKALFSSGKINTIIFLDGSWSQASGMFKALLNIGFTTSWHFNHHPPSRYEIRHTNIGNAVSTLESIAYVLEQGCSVPTDSMLTLLDKFQSHWRGPAQHRRKTRG